MNSKCHIFVDSIRLGFVILIINGSLWSCTETKKQTTDNDTTQLVSSMIDSVSSPNESIVPKNEFSSLMQVIYLLPDSAMRSWKWPLNMRKEFEFNAYHGKSSHSKNSFSDIIYLNPAGTRLQIVDAVWAVQLFKIDSVEYLVVTDDMVSGGNDFCFYSYKEGNLTVWAGNPIFDAAKAILKKPEDVICQEQLYQSLIFSEVDLRNYMQLHIEFNEIGEPENQEECLDRTSFTLVFNPEIRGFVLEK